MRTPLRGNGHDRVRVSRPRLSNRISELKDHYTVVVVGSGYGGAIAASRMARLGKDVCVLERGKEFRPGDFPTTALRALPQMQFDFKRGHLFSETGLFDIRVNRDLHVLVGCGLGGTSLINASVAMRPRPWVFAHGWPKDFSTDVSQGLENGFTRAEEMLNPSPYPSDFPLPSKYLALRKAAAGLAEPCHTVPVHVNFVNDGKNQVGVEQRPCRLCGNCVCGCNYGAKNTLDTNYLPDAKNHGAEIYTEVRVHHIAPDDDGWLVYYQLPRRKKLPGLLGTKFRDGEKPVHADVLILAAGTLGSTEILLRSRNQAFQLSDKLGQRVSGNADAIGFAYNTDRAMNAVGTGRRKRRPIRPVGPCITGVIDARQQAGPAEEMVIEEGVIPRTLGRFATYFLASAAALVGEPTRRGPLDRLRRTRRKLWGFVKGPYRGTIRNTLTYLVNAHDQHDGKLVLENDRVRTDWKGVGKKPIFEVIDERLNRATQPLGGTYVKNPLWSELAGHDLATVHPLGGCAMAESGEEGVVDHKCQVFSGTTGKDVHPGLYVCDGAVIPRSLGANPLLTISAIAERCCALIAQDRAWGEIDYSLPRARQNGAPQMQAPPPLQTPPPDQIGIEFQETLKGRIKLATGVEGGITAKLTITCNDFESLVNMGHRGHESRAEGHVLLAGLSNGQPLDARGKFNMFSVDVQQQNTHVMTYQMIYQLTLTTRDGHRYFLDGRKSLHDNPGFDMWSDATTVNFTLHEGADPAGAVVGRGTLEIDIGAFWDLLNSIKIFYPYDPDKKEPGLGAQLNCRWRFGRFFLGRLNEVYGFGTSVFNPTSPKRVRRPLKLPPPQCVSVDTDDGESIMLTRYNDPAKSGKGPVLLAPGFGTSSQAFRLDTIDVSLAEYLFENGYDVWLFDYRASPMLGSARSQFSLDEVATYDWPAAVAKILDQTQAESVQALGHCVGSATLLMSLLSGRLRGVRTAICSQFTTHVDTPLVLRIKGRLRLPTLLSVLQDHMTPAFDRRAGWDRWLLDWILRMTNPLLGKTCEIKPICRRILFMYGEVYDHDQLNQDTHLAIDEMFGIANMTTFRHLARIVRKRRVVDRSGRDVYMQGVGQLENTRVAILQGLKNRIFLPEGSRKTYEWLRGSHKQPELVEWMERPEYAHMDCFIGKDAERDVFPSILGVLEQDAKPTKPYAGPDRRSLWDRRRVYLEYYGSERRRGGDRRRSQRRVGGARP